MNTWMKKPLLIVLTATAMAAQAAAPEPAPAADDPHHTQSAPAASTTKDINVQLQHMRQMHDRMLAAKTPAERQALMAEYRQVMGTGMMMMQQMYGKSGQSGKPGAMMHPGMMDMMGMMMTMMHDGGCMDGMGSMPAAPAKQ